MQKVIRKRVNITLPKDTIHFIDRVAGKWDRSRFLDEAVWFYVRKLLREGTAYRLGFLTV